MLVSSTAVYGESNGGLVNEETAPGPTGFNGKALLKMEHNASRCAANLVVVRISGIYGPGRERLISLAAKQGYEVQKFPEYFTNRIHRDDAAAALKHLLVIDKPEALYLASDDEPAAKYEVVDWLAKMQSCVSPKGLTCENGSHGKRVSNQRLRDSGFSLFYPDYKTGYTAILKRRAES